MKRYIKPSIEIMAFAADDALLALSEVNNNKWQGSGDGIGEQYGNRRGWSSDNWADDEE